MVYAGLEKVSALYKNRVVLLGVRDSRVNTGNE